MGLKMNEDVEMSEEADEFERDLEGLELDD